MLRSRSIGRCLLASVAMIGIGGSVYAQGSAEPNTVEQYQGRAKNEAGLDWSGTLLRLCIPPAPVDADPAAEAAAKADPTNGQGTNGRPIPPRETWYASPAKVFDNLYWVGDQEVSSWALVDAKTKGIILIDNPQEFAHQAEVLDGFRKLGLDPKNVKYIILSHSHGIGDHDGSARWFQDNVPGVHVIMGAPDWAAMAAGMRGGYFKWGKPKHDMDAVDGQKVTVGDTTVTLYATPGHTPGTFSMIFNVSDHGKPATVAYTGGTAINFAGSPAYYDTYISSVAKMGKIAADAHASIFMSNHSEFDNAYYRSRAALARGPEDTNPFVIGEQGVQAYYKMAGDCAHADALRMKQS